MTGKSVSGTFHQKGKDTRGERKGRNYSDVMFRAWIAEGNVGRAELGRSGPRRSM